MSPSSAGGFWVRPALIQNSGSAQAQTAAIPGGIARYERRCQRRCRSANRASKGADSRRRRHSGGFRILRAGRPLSIMLRRTSQQRAHTGMGCRDVGGDGP